MKNPLSKHNPIFKVGDIIIKKDYKQPKPYKVMFVNLEEGFYTIMNGLGRNAVIKTMNFYHQDNYSKVN